MKQRICDRCKTIIRDGKERFRITTYVPGRTSTVGKDLCPKCYESFMDFMANEPTQVSKVQ